jgi:hypothetical protein
LSGVECWGSDYSGELGNGQSGGFSTEPVEVIGLADVDTDGDTLPDAADADSDNDGCEDSREVQADPTQGGSRNPKSVWDFFDTDTENGLGAGTQLAGAVSVGDIVRVVMHFGQSGDPAIDPLSDASNFASYHTRFDRTPLGNFTGAPDGAVSVGDIVAVVNQFGHSCAAS